MVVVVLVVVAVGVGVGVLRQSKQHVGRLGGDAGLLGL